MADPLIFPRRPATRRPGPPLGWWPRAWLRSIEELADHEATLAEGRRWARGGQLGAVVVIAGMASAEVDRSAGAPVLAQVRVDRIDDAGWELFTAELLRHSGHLAALESGELPTELVEAADEAGVEVIPGPGELTTACSCTAWTQPCGHVLALMVRLADCLQADPYALLLLRGRTREQLLAAADAPVVAANETADAGRRAAEILRLADAAPAGHGLADTAVAAYDEEVGRLV